MTQLVTNASPFFPTRVTVADTDYTVTQTSGLSIAYTSITAPRVVNLPASSLSPGQVIQVGDESGNCGPTHTITILAAGSDKIDGNASKIINYPYGSLTIENGGSGAWVVTAASDHNSLANLQGGTTSQYYHLTSAEYTGTGAGNFVRLNAPTVTGTWTFSGPVKITDTTASTSTTTGALVVSGGVGVGGALNVGSTIKSNVYTVATLPTGSAGMRAFASDAIKPVVPVMVGDGTTTAFQLQYPVPVGANIYRMDWQPFVPFSVAWHAYGDSITAGSYYTTGLATDRSLTLTNHAVSGSQAADQSVPILATVVAAYQFSTYFCGTNDEKFYGTNALRLAAFQSAVTDGVAWLALPDTAKLKGTSAGVTYVGTWSASALYAGMPKQTSTNGDTASFSVTGQTVYISMLSINGDAGTYSISIDGVSQGAFNTDPGVGITTYLGIAYTPRLLRFTGLTNAAHTIVITKTSAGGTITFNWAAGVVTAGTKGPRVLVSNLYNLTAAGYTGSGGTGSDANVASYNTTIAGVVATLAADGLTVGMVDCSVIQTSELVDGIHPTTAGGTHIKNLFEAVTFTPITSALSALPRTNNLLQSDDFTSASWTTTGATVTANAMTAADGSLTMDKLVETAVSSDHRIYQGFSGLVVGARYTASFFAKAAERSKFRIVIAGNEEVVFDLISVTATTVPTTGPGTAVGKIEPWGDGLFRCSVDFVSANTGPNLQVGLTPDGTTWIYMGTAGAGIYLWRGDLKAGPLSPAIPTTTAAVTVTDYTLSTTGLVTTASPPSVGALVNWGYAGAPMYHNGTQWIID